MSQTVLGLARTFGIDPALVTVQGGSRKDRHCDHRQNTRNEAGYKCSAVASLGFSS